MPGEELSSKKLESIAINRCHAVSNGHRCLRESRVNNRCHASSNGHRCQGGALRERATNRCHAVWSPMVTDARRCRCHAVRDGHRCQGGALIESRVTNRCHASSNGHRCQEEHRESRCRCHASSNGHRCQGGALIESANRCTVGMVTDARRNVRPDPVNCTDRC